MPKTILVCSECDSCNYKTSRDSSVQEEPLRLNKYCSKCKKKTLHKETV